MLYNECIAKVFVVPELDAIKYLLHLLLLEETVDNYIILASLLDMELTPFRIIDVVLFYLQLEQIALAHQRVKFRGNVRWIIALFVALQKEIKSGDMRILYGLMASN